MKGANKNKQINAQKNLFFAKKKKTKTEAIEKDECLGLCIQDGMM